MMSVVTPRELLEVVRHNPQYTSTAGLGRVSVISVALGLSLSSGLFCAILWPRWFQLELFVSMMSLFHLLEFLLTSLFHPGTLTADAFLLNHSPQFNMAIGAGIVEYLIESLLFPHIKSYYLLVFLGACMIVLGQIVRSIAMLTAGKSFSHLIADKRQPDHVLVTNGIYSIFRHPSYFGFFFWAVGSQVFLVNPVCTAAFLYVTWNFFRERIQHEEVTLVEFFGEKYVEYRKRVPSRIPFIP